MDSTSRIHNNPDESMIIHESNKTNHFHEDLSFSTKEFSLFFPPFLSSFFLDRLVFFPLSDFIIGIGLMADSGSRGSGISDSFARWIIGH